MYKLDKVGIHTKISKEIQYAIVLLIKMLPSVNFVAFA